MTQKQPPSRRVSYSAATFSCLILFGTCCWSGCHSTENQTELTLENHADSDPAERQFEQPATALASDIPTVHDDLPNQSSKLNLLEEPQLSFWVPAKFGGQGDTSVTSDKIELGFGYNMTGVVFTGDMPTDNFQLTYEARRISGSDFFGTLTFPVGESHCSLVLGGWGGATVGLSSLDGEDASQNETRKIIGFDTEQWYAIKIEVDYPVIRCWIDDQLTIDIDVTGRQVSVRGDVQVCVPLGFCSFETEAEIRHVHLVTFNDANE